MNVSLTPELDSFVAGKVESGRYNSASGVVREALRLLEEHDRARSAQIAAFNQEIGARLAFWIVVSMSSQGRCGSGWSKSPTSGES